MNFEELLQELTPKLNSISKRAKRNITYIDSNDLYQEMAAYLWERWENGKIKGYTRSYLLQACWFHISNYIRIKTDKTDILSLDDQVNETDICLFDIIADESEGNDTVDFNIAVDAVLDKNLTEREKEVFILTLEGFTLREIAKSLNISFPRVAKIQKNIKNKVKHLNCI